MKMRNSILAAATLAVLGLSSPAWAQQAVGDGDGGSNTSTNTLSEANTNIETTTTTIDESDQSSGDFRDSVGRAIGEGTGSAAATNGSTSSASVAGSFNTNTVVAETALDGEVTGNSVQGLGNLADNSGGAFGGQGSTGADASADGRASSDGGVAGEGEEGLAGTSSVTSTATAGDGGAGGDVGSLTADAGAFDMSNSMDGTANAAAGLMVMAQNSGASSFVQQGVTVQANLSVGGGQ